MEVPATFNWYHGRLDRVKAEAMLKGQYDGTFVVRDSSSRAGDYVISVSDDTTRNGITHFIVAGDGIGGYVASDQKFDSLEHVVMHYGQSKLGKTPLQFYRCQDTLEIVPLIAAAPESETYECLPSTTTITNTAIAIAERTPNAYDNTSLTFKVGEMISVLEQHPSGTWKGECNGQIGHFPFTAIAWWDKSAPMI